MRHLLDTRVATLILVGLVTTIACTDGDPVEVRADSSAEAAEIEPGAEFEIPRTDRGSLMAIFDGRLDDDGNFGVELADVYDADVYVGPKNEAGDPHWVTRARVLDDEGETLWTQRINSHYQLLEFMSPVVEEFNPTDIDFDVEHLYNIAVDDYPELLQFPAKIPNELEGADRYALEIHDTADGVWQEVANHSIAELEDQAGPPDPQLDYEIESLVEHGPDSDHINIAILGDGYTEDEREIFEQDAQAVADRFMDEPVIDDHGDLFNIRTVWTPSQESGAGFDCNHSGADDDCEQRFRDTAFDTTFLVPALAEEYGFPLGDVTDRVAAPLSVADAYEVAALAGYDEVILISNTDKFSGFAGLYVALVTNFDDRDYFPDTAVHEVGHTLGLLGDEYYNTVDACYYNEPDIPLPVNIATVDDEQVKWSEWMDEDAPVPTPTYEAGDYPVGAFLPAYNCEFLARPEVSCKMNSSDDDFCTVCAEQMVRRFYSVVDPAGAGEATLEVTDDGSVRIRVPVRVAGSDRYEVAWAVDGQPVQRPGSLLELSPDQLDGQWTEVTATVRNTTDYLHTVDHVVESDFTFEVRSTTPAGP